VLKRDPPVAGDQRFVAKTIAELKKGGALNDPRPYNRSLALSDYVLGEVRRSIDRVRLLLTYRPPTPNLTLSDYREAVKALRKVAFTEEQRAAIRQLEAVRQEPPERANALKYHCAAEMYFLMECFSAKEPTGSDEGPFQTGAAHIYEAVTGCESDDMKRACALVLRERRRTPNRFSKRP
jgi:hypothetical protein